MTTKELVEQLERADPDGNLPVGIETAESEIVPIAQVAVFDIPAVVLIPNPEGGF